MFRTIFIFTLLLVTTSVFSQSRFMAGVSVMPNMSIHRDINYPNLQYYTGFSLGAGANFGICLGKRLFLLTGMEGTGAHYRAQGKNMVYDSSGFSLGHYKTINSYRAWDVPLLFNYMVTNASKKISFFVTAGLYYGRYTYKNLQENETGSYPFNFSNTQRGKEIINPIYAGLILGFGCKINLNKKYSLLIMPDYNLSDIKLIQLRTMLVYNFGKFKSKKS